MADPRVGVRFPFSSVSIGTSDLDLISAESSRDADNAVDDRLAAVIDAARRGSTEALGELAEACRAYLLLVANREMSPQLRSKFGASDIVQETLIRAQRGIGEFRGQAENDLLAWLRRILLNLLRNAQRDFEQAQCRKIGREERIDDDRPAAARSLRDGKNTPRTAAVADEDAMMLRLALAALPDDYRQVVVLRNWDRLSFDEIGVRMDRSAEAVRKLWARAIVRLQRELEGDDEH
ncbi:MAG: RNA polymerase subunit sigma-70 [Planctomycetota bacterium]|nr:MAG: RNA polymerase subunit sigma-70 [Planctomycetota bacterium]